MARYLLHTDHYRRGVLHRAGTVITVPDEEKPGRDWEPLDGGAPEAETPVDTVSPPPEAPKAAPAAKGKNTPPAAKGKNASGPKAKNGLAVSDPEAGDEKDALPSAPEAAAESQRAADGDPF